MSFLPYFFINLIYVSLKVEQSLYGKGDNVSGELIEDTKLLMQFYNEKNQKLRKLISKMKSRNSSLGTKVITFFQKSPSNSIMFIHNSFLESTKDFYAA